MKLLGTMFFLILSVVAHARNPVRIALLTSLEQNDGKRFYHGRDYDINQKIETEFRKHLGPDEFDLLVVHRATLSDVWTTMHDESIQAVFFVGHAGGWASFGSQGVIEAPAMIADFKVDDLKNAFQSVNRNMKYLALIGCNSQSIMDKFIANNFYSNAPDLVIKAFNHKVEVMKGIREAVVQGKKVLAKNSALDETEKERSIDSRLIISREIPHNADADNVYPTLVLIENKVLGFFPKGLPGEIQTIELDDTEIKDGPVTLINDSGLKSTYKKSEVVLGDLKLESTLSGCELKGERNSRGKLLGVGKNFYKLKCN